MKPLAIRQAEESPPKSHIPEPEPSPAVARIKLSELTHRIQLIIRSKPIAMLPLLDFYHYFLEVKEDLEDFFSREQSLLKSLSQTGGASGRDDTASPPSDQNQELGTTLARLKEELSDFLVLLSNLQINHKSLKAFSVTLTLFFKELESFVRLLDAHREHLSHAVLLPTTRLT